MSDTTKFLPFLKNTSGDEAIYLSLRDYAEVAVASRLQLAELFFIVLDIGVGVVKTRVKALGKLPNSKVITEVLGMFHTRVSRDGLSLFLNVVEHVTTEEVVSSMTNKSLSGLPKEGIAIFLYVESLLQKNKVYSTAEFGWLVNVDMVNSVLSNIADFVTFSGVAREKVFADRRELEAYILAVALFKGTAVVNPVLRYSVVPTPNEVEVKEDVDYFPL